MLVKIDNCLTFHKEDRDEMYIGKVKKRLGFHNTKEDEFPHAPCQHTLQSLAAASSRPPYLTISVNNLSLHLSTTELLRHLSIYKRWIPLGILQLLEYKNDLITFLNYTLYQKPKPS